jgi:hypothetical protein
MASIINATTTAGVSVQGDNSGSLQLATNNGTTAVTIDTSQNVGIGTTTPTDDGGYGKIVDIYGSTGGALYLHTSTATNYAFLGKYNASTQLADSGSAGLTFATASGSTPIERMRIDSSGNLLVGTTSSILSGTTCFVTGSGNVPFKFSGGSLIAWNSGTAGTRTLIEFGTGAAYSVKGSISTDGTTVSYNVTSDYRLKENVAPMTGALAKVSALKPVTYTWKDGNKDGQGFIAHELQAVVPDCVVGEKDAVETYLDDEGNEQTRPKYQSIDTSFLVATLTAAIQELKAELDATKAEVQALKGVA